MSSATSVIGLTLRRIRAILPACHRVSRPGVCRQSGLSIPGCQYLITRLPSAVTVRHEGREKSAPAIGRRRRGDGPASATQARRRAVSCGSRGARHCRDSLENSAFTARLMDSNFADNVTGRTVRDEPVSTFFSSCVRLPARSDNGAFPRPPPPPPPPPPRGNERFIRQELKGTRVYRLFLASR